MEEQETVQTKKGENQGQINEGCDVENEDKVEAETSVAEEEQSRENEGNPVGLKHARFKIFNHSRNELNLEGGEECLNDVEELAISPKPRSSIKSTGRRSNDCPSPVLRNEHNLQVNQVTFSTHGYETTDAIPMTMFYRDEHSLANRALQRPTLEELHKGADRDGGRDQKFRISEAENGGVNIVNAPKMSKLGWIKGVLFPCLLNIWGVIMFLRLSWVVGQAGIGLASVIVLLSTVVTVVTSLSMSAVCTNGEVKGGGAYYLISRSLGPEFGGSIGVVFSIANAVAVALYIVGFAETVGELMLKYNTQMIDSVNDVRIIGIIALVMLFVVTMIGLEWVVYTQVVLLIILVLSIFCVIIGTFYPNPSVSRERVESYGIMGYQLQLFKDNFVPQYRDGNGFFSVFSIFFPAATGILAGANLSGDLKNPSKSVPKGTIGAIIVTSITYVVMCWLIGSVVQRDASGIILSGNLTLNDTLCAIGSCKFGLMNDFQVLEKLSLWGPVVTSGIFAATLSSALASLVSAPKVFQAVCKDNIFPGIQFFGKGFGNNNEPRRGYVLAFFVGAAFIAIGDLNIIAPIISNFFLMAYALINYSVFAASLAKSPGWRPSFKYYNKWISFIGFLLCIAIMFLINWWAALTTIACISALYKFVDFRKPDINWGSSGQAHTYLKALRFTRRLDQLDEHVKNFRVNCLTLSGQPSARPNLVHFVSHITKHYGLMICGEVKILENLHQFDAHERIWLKKHKIKAFHQMVQSVSVRDGVRSLLQCSGLGKLKPNTLILGYMKRWQSSSRNSVEEYVGMLHDAFDLNYGVAILRLQDGFDITEDMEDDLEEVFTNGEPDWFTEDWDESQYGQRHPERISTCDETEHPPVTKVQSASKAPSSQGNPEIVIAFDKKKKGTIDVWWLYDDGGLTILIPHLLSISSHWRGCDLRIFTPASDKKIKANQIRMANLLKKFRIDFSSVVEFRGINKSPADESIKEFSRFRNGEHLAEEMHGLDKKTLRQIRLGELVREHSHDAKLVVLTLPIPKKSVVTSLMYMSWLEVLSGDLPPVLLIRGNQTSVLTFYS